jgi:uncharacterized lipoprotein YddW (UPF0748 family)
LSGKKVVLVTTFFLFCQQYQLLAADQLAVRGLWVVRESMTSRSEIDAALRFARDSGFNHVFLQVRGRGDAYYQSILVTRSTRVRNSNFDPLGYAVERGHALGLNVHAWVTTYLLWSARFKPDAPTHIYNLHPEWLDANAAGLEQREINLAAPRDGKFEGVYLSPTHPEVNNYLQAVFTELILNYNIDGLHLDYIRYYDFDYGFNEEGLGVYIRRNNFDPRELSMRRASTQNAASWERRKSVWDQYRRDKITELVKSLHAIITLSGKEVILSAAVKPEINKAENVYFQDWVSWLDDGIIDYVLPMNYSPQATKYTERIVNIANQVPVPLLDRVIMGVAVYNQTAQSAANKVRVARRYGYKSFCIFSYDAYKTDLSRFQPIVEVLRQ